MRGAVRWVVVGVLALHSLIHLLGAAKAFGWAEVSQLSEPISVGLGVGWLVAAVLLFATAALLAVRDRRWWVVGGFAAVLSQAVIVTSWSDAAAGTAANVLLVVAVGYGYASQGPRSFRAEYRRRVRALGDAARRGSPGDGAGRDAAETASGVVREADLAHLPAPVAAYVRQSGAVGQERVTSFSAAIHGRIRAGAGKPWMRFTGEQVDAFGPDPSRLLFMDATMAGLPVDVLHVLAAGHATMRVRACSVVPIVHAAGPEMDQAETVTLFNDLCVLAPAVLVDAPIAWTPLDARRARGAFTHGAHTVSAELTFDAEGRLIDFVSDDRLRASADGSAFTRQRWSTPLGSYRDIGAGRGVRHVVRRVATFGEGRWHAPAPEGEFAYLEFSVDEIAYNVDGVRPQVAAEFPRATR